MGNSLAKGEQVAYPTYAWLLRQRTPRVGKTSKQRSRGSHEGEAPVENPAAASSSTKLPEKLQEIISDFISFKDPSKIDDLIRMMKELLQTIKSQQPDNASTSSRVTQKRNEKRSMLKHFAKTGSKFLKSVNDHLEKTGLKEDSKDCSKVASEILQLLGQTYWIVGGLSMIAYLLSKIDKMSENRTECLELLECMVDLAGHLKSLKEMVSQREEKFAYAIQMIVEGSIICASQLKSNKFSRFLKASVNSETLGSLRRKISQSQQDLILITGIETLSQVPSYHPLTKPVYPGKTVGIEKQVNEIVDLLRTTEQSSLAVIIYGFGGIGKTTVAEAVVSKMDLNNYNYTRVNIYEEQLNNTFTSLQQQILNDCFPDYNGGKPIVLRNFEDGRGQLMEAFKCNKNRAIFLFIDNALRSTDLKRVLPEDLEALPQGSRILVTTRNFATTVMFEGQPNLRRKPYPLQTLPDKDAMEILFKDQTKRGEIENANLKRILKICSGVPLALKIVGAQFQKQEYQDDKYDDLLEALEKGVTIKEEKLSERLVDFVYGELEEYIQEALLDICCFFTKWKRQDVEYIVGATAVTSLLEAGLITSTAQHDCSNAIFPHDDEFLVHDIIRAKGRSLAKDNRILDIQSLYEAANEQRLHQIKGIWLVEDKSEHVIEEKHLSSMRKSLRVLALGDRMKVSQVSQMKFEELRFLHVSGDIPQLPVKLEELDNLRVFHGPFFKLPKNVLAMKVIGQCHSAEYSKSQMTQCSLEKLDFGELKELPKLPKRFNQLSTLKILNLPLLVEKQELHELITRLPSLRVLSMRRCRRLERLPKSFGQLTTLTHLDMQSCERLQCLPESLGQLTTLTSLLLDDCTKLKKLPATLGQLTALTHLSLHGCKELKALPDTFEQLNALTHLDLHGCKTLKTLPFTFGQLTSLRHLDLHSCKSLETLPATFEQLSALAHLDLHGCKALRSLPATFGRLTALTHLDLHGCKELETLPATFGQLSALKDLDLSDCDKIEALPSNFRQLMSLQHLECSEKLLSVVESQICSQVLINTGFFHELQKGMHEIENPNACVICWASLLCAYKHLRPKFDHSLAVLRHFYHKIQSKF